MSKKPTTRKTVEPTTRKTSSPSPRKANRDGGDGSEDDFAALQKVADHSTGTSTTTKPQVQVQQQQQQQQQQQVKPVPRQAEKPLQTEQVKQMEIAERKRKFAMLRCSRMDIVKKAKRMRGSGKRSRCKLPVVFLGTYEREVKKENSKLKSVRKGWVIPTAPSQCVVEQMTYENRETNNGYFDVIKRAYMVAVSRTKKDTAQQATTADVDKLFPGAQCGNATTTTTSAASATSTTNTNATSAASTTTTGYKVQASACGMCADSMDADDECVESFKELPLYRPVVTTIWEAGDNGNNIAIAHSVASNVYKGKLGLNCQSVDTVTNYNNSVMKMILEHFPKHAMMFPNYRYGNYGRVGCFLKYDPFAKTTDEDIDFSENSVVLSRDLVPILDDQVPKEKRFTKDPILKVDISGQVIQWCYESETTPGAMALSMHASPFYESVLVKISIYREFVVQMFGVPEEDRWRNVVFRYTEFTPMMISGCIKPEDTIGNEHNLGEKDENFHCSIIASACKVYSRARWTIKTATIPVTANFILACAFNKVKASEAGVTDEFKTMCTPESFFDKNYEKFERHPYTSDNKMLDKSISCLTYMGAQWTIMAAEKVKNGEGKFRVMANIITPKADVAAGKYRNMTPEEGVKLLSNTMPENRTWSFVLYYVSNRSQEKIQAKNDATYETLMGALQKLNLKFDPKIFNDNGYQVPKAD